MIYIHFSPWCEAEILLDVNKPMFKVVFLATCLEPRDGGPCGAAFPYYYYDSTTGQCTLFLWGGCGGNGNRYQTEADCEAACEGPVCTTCPACTDPNTVPTNQTDAAGCPVCHCKSKFNIQSQT